MTQKQFREWLLLYGSDLAKWPERERRLAKQALSHPERQGMIAAEKAFEALLQQQFIEESSEDLAERIIAQAQPRMTTLTSNSLNKLWSWLWTPRRLAATAIVFALGLLLGWSQPFSGESTTTDSAQLSDILYYEEVGV